jgi:hypothetical protein
MNITMKNYIKNKTISGLCVAVLSLGAIQSCSSDYVEDVQNKGAFNTDEFFKDRNQAFQALIGVYDPINKYAAGFENTITFFNAASDDFNAGGGNATDGIGIQSFSNYSIDSYKISRE